MMTAKAWSQDYVPGEVIVKLKSAAGSQGSFVFMGKAHSQKEMSLKGSYGKMGMYHFGLRKGQTVENAIQELKQDPDVEYVEPNYIFRKSDDTGIIRTYTQAEIEQLAQGQSATWISGGVDIGLQSFYDDNQSQSGGLQAASVSAQASVRPIIAIIDTGLDLNHPVFVDTNSVWTNSGEIAGNGHDDDGNGYVDDVHGWNFVDNTGTMYDDDGHGTHVAGIVLSVDQNILAANKHDSRIQIMPLKFLDGNGVGTTANAIKAIYYGVQNGAVVMNNSWGGPSYSGALHEAIAYAYNAGISFPAAAGNAAGNNDSYPMYPASYDVPNVIAVAATNDQDNLASFSNYGRNTVHLGSPGVMIYSTIPGGWGSSSGTSMAAPYVAGVAIQMKVESPNMLGYQIKSVILSQADPKASLATKIYSGSRLDVTNSINYAQTAVVDSTQPAYYGAYSQNRELASSLAGGGCGLVTKLFRDSRGGIDDNQPPSQGPETWYVLVVIALLAAPVIVAQFLRHRSPESRRRHERFRINSEVTVMVGDRELVGSISTISLGGVQLNTQAMLENGGVVQMQISSPDGKENIQVEGKVVWSEAKKAYGVAFSNAPHSALYRISQWTKGLQRTG
ncbi:MAG: S8 family serine peptidase [Bdellovibrionales bacterium]